MRLAIILPGELPEEAKGALQANYKRIVASGTDTAIFEVKGSQIRVAGDIDLLIPKATDIAKQAEKQGFDALVLNGMCDFALRAARGAVQTPVVGAASATYHLVYQLASKYGVISVNERLNPIFIRAIKESGCYERMTSMRAIGKPLTLPMGEFYTPDEMEEELLRIGRKQVEEGAQVLVVACTLISLFLKPGALNRLRERLGVMVIDPQPIALKTAEMLAGLRLAQSDLEYPHNA